jgi:hypothetical protein
MLFHVKHNSLIYNKMRNVEILLFVAKRVANVLHFTAKWPFVAFFGNRQLYYSKALHRIYCAQKCNKRYLV